MRRFAFLTATAVVTLFCQSAFGSAPDLRDHVNSLELRIAGTCDPGLSLAARVAKLEEVVYGHAKTGPLLKRITDLRDATGPAQCQPSSPAGTTQLSATESREGPADKDIRLGIKLHAQGQLEEAEQAFRSALLADPENADAHFNMGVLYEEGGHLTSALLHYQAAAYAAPKDPEITGTIDAVQRKLVSQSEAKPQQTGKAGLFHADNISAPLLQGSVQNFKSAIDAQFATTIEASEKQVAKSTRRAHPVRQKVLYTAAVLGMAATANLPGGNVSNTILGTVRRSFSCPLCHWISRF